MSAWEVRYEYPDDAYPVFMEDSVNKKLDGNHIDIYEHDID